LTLPPRAGVDEHPDIAEAVDHESLDRRALGIGPADGQAKRGRPGVRAVEFDRELALVFELFAAAPSCV
jgi:hypothetical protein